jgi:glycosyltransferase involved in cell wall biosynthesis
MCPQTQRAVPDGSDRPPGHRAPPLSPRKLSVAIIAQNEEARIGPTLDAITCADEILVVDGGSDDRTVEICQARGCRVTVRRFDDFCTQKRFAAGLASNDWVLALDADEVLTPALNEEIRAVMSRDDVPEAAFRVQMTLVFQGRRFRHGKHARERHVRLFDRRRASYDDRPLHEGIVTQGAVGLLREPLIHYSVRDLSHGIAKMNDYTTRGAMILHASGVRRSRPLAILAWPIYFLKSYVMHRNALNGAPGLVWSFLHATSAVMKYLKLDEMRRAR